MSWKDTAFNVAAFGFFVNGFVVMARTSGYFDTLGVELSPLPSVTQINNGLASFSPAQGVGDTLFALINIVVGAFRIVPDFLYAFPNLLIQLNIDPWLVSFVFAADTLVWFAAIAYFLIGRDV